MPLFSVKKPQETTCSILANSSQKSLELSRLNFTITKIKTKQMEIYRVKIDSPVNQIYKMSDLVAGRQFYK